MKSYLILSLIVTFSFCLLLLPSDSFAQCFQKLDDGSYVENPFCGQPYIDTSGKDRCSLAISTDKEKYNLGDKVIIKVWKWPEDCGQDKSHNIKITIWGNGQTFKNIILENEVFEFTYQLGAGYKTGQYKIYADGLGVVGTEYYFDVMSNSYKNPSQGGGCLIATATFDSELAPQVQKLREIRDSKLLSTESGSQFMEHFNSFYYSFSPYIADYERENPVFKEIVKIGITPMLSTLSLMDYADTESEVLGIGISLIILNAMMYVGLPVFGIMRLRK